MVKSIVADNRSTGRDGSSGRSDYFGADSQDSASFAGGAIGFVVAPEFVGKPLQNLTTLNLRVAANSPYADRFADGDYIGYYSDLGAATLKDYSVVTTLVDEYDLTNDAVSLREAITLAPAGTTITFDQSLTGNRILLNATLGNIEVQNSVTVDGTLGDAWVVLDAQKNSRVLWNGGALALRNLELTNGSENAGAGAICNFGTLTAENIAIYGNTATHGGAIYAHAQSSTTLNHVTIAGNYASSQGGGVFRYYDSNASLTVTNSIIAQNQSPDGPNVSNFTPTERDERLFRNRRVYRSAGLCGQRFAERGLPESASLFAVRL